MAKDVMLIFTAQSLEKCLEVGGTRSWVLNRARAKRCKYVILCRNAHTDWGDGKEPHGTAFMVGRIADVIPTTDVDVKDRWLITFSEYDRMNIPRFWKGWRNPIHYTNLQQLGISLDTVQFKPMTRTSEGIRGNSSALTKLTIAEAKKALGATFNVKPAAVEIVIHG